MIKTVECFADIYSTNRRPRNKYYGICCKYVRITKFMTKMIAAIYVAAASCALLGGLIESIIKRERLPIARLYFPMINDDYTNNALYGLVLAYNICSLYLWVMCVMPSDEIFFMITVNMLMIPEIVQQDMDELAVQLMQKSTTGRDHLLRYMKTHQQFNM